MTRILEGRAALVTGASQGLGKEIARAFVEQGASVAICARDRAMIEAARDELRTLATGDQRVIARACDVSKPDQVTALAEHAIATFPELDILVNNAGIHGPKGPVEDNDWTAWVQAIEIDLFGSVLLCRALVPHLKKRGYGKVIQLSGGGATQPMRGLSAYASAKAAVVRFAETLAVEVREHRIDVNCIAPGALNTRLLEDVLAAGPAAVGNDYYQRALKQKESGGAPIEKAAALAVFLASPNSDGVTGKLISAVWDPWSELPEHAADLGGDIYTLRRIVPADRGKDWGDKK
jgi:NAD(P)-dependent dehydrogenase (short-subunit alcohol dehydrogenase family)